MVERFRRAAYRPAGCCEAERDRPASFDALADSETQFEVAETKMPFTGADFLFDLSWRLIIIATEPARFGRVLDIGCRIRALFILQPYPGVAVGLHLKLGVQATSGAQRQGRHRAHDAAIGVGMVSDDVTVLVRHGDSFGDRRDAAGGVREFGTSLVAKINVMVGAAESRPVGSGEGATGGRGGVGVDHAVHRPGSTVSRQNSRASLR